METKPPKPSAKKLRPLTPSEQGEASQNLLACLEAHEKGGSSALDEALSKIQRPRPNPHLSISDKPANVEISQPEI